MHGKAERLQALRDLRILDTPPEAQFDDLVQLAALTFDTPTALISLIDDNRQWFKARVGLDLTETPLELSFCQHVVRQDQVMTVCDATLDPRFKDNPLVTGEPGVRFYAGAPLTMPGGEHVGALCVIDYQPRPPLSEAQSQRLTALADSVSRIMVSRSQELRNAERLRSLNWALSAYARSTSALLHSRGLETIAPRVCDAIVAGEAYSLAAVALVDDREAKSLRVVAGAGQAVGYADGLRLGWDERRVEGGGPTGRAIRSKAPQIMRDSLTDPFYEAWRERGLAYGIRSSVTVPFFDRDDQLLGVLLVYAPRPDAFGDDEMSLFQRLAEEMAFAIAVQEDRQRLSLARDAEKQAQRKLSQSEELFRLLAENSVDLVLRYDLEGRIEYASPSFQRLGFDPQAIIGLNILEFDIEPLRPDRVPSNDAARLRAPMQSGDFNIFRLRCPDGTRRWMQGNPSPLLDPEGKPIAVTTVIRDITDLREMEDELRRKSAEAEAAAIVKSQFLANMSHEIRTPLTGVLGFAGLLEAMDDLPDAARLYVDRIITGGRALLSIVNEVLDFSRLEAGKLELEAQPFETVPFFEAAIALALPDARRKGLSLALTFDGEPPRHLLADSARLRQVLLNLVSNAIKFTETGGVTVRVAHGADDDLQVTVTDTGPGITVEAQSRLFQRFSQVDGSNTREHGGAGLGLAISKGLVEMMGGQIGVESVEGEGAQFWFTAPAPAVAAPQAPEIVEDDDLSDEPLKLLVVDDVAVNRELIAAMLSPFDLTLTEAANGAEAVETAMRERFDLILMDLQMPGMDGLAATRAIRANSDLNRTAPILAVSANVMPAQVEACLSAGMNDHIGKPINPRDLVSKIARWTEARAD